MSGAAPETADRLRFARLAIALAAAVGLHAGLYAWLATIRAPGAEATPVAAGSRGNDVEFAVVYAPAGGGGGDGAPESAPAPAPQPQPRRVRTRVLAGTEAVAAPQPAGQEAVEPAAGDEVAVAASGGNGSGDGPAETGSGSGAGSRSGARSPTGAGSGAGSGAGEGSALGEIHSRLARAAAGCYPRAALRFGSEGIARVRFCVDGAGRPAQVKLVESSGATLLDEAALGCVLERAAPFPATSECVIAPVQFTVKR